MDDSITSQAIDVEEENLEGSFESLTAAQKRFHILFYITACLTGILLVQFVWQIAILTAGQ
jgi:hypothetical protein